MLGTVTGKRRALESGTSRLESRACCLCSLLTSDTVLNVSKLYFPTCKMEIMIVLIVLYEDFLLLLYSVVLVLLQ